MSPGSAPTGRSPAGWPAILLFVFGLADEVGVLDTNNGWCTESELVCFSLDGSGPRFRLPGGQNQRLLPTKGRLGALEASAEGTRVVLIDLATGETRWRSAPVFSGQSGVVTLHDGGVLAWLDGRPSCPSTS